MVREVSASRTVPWRPGNPIRTEDKRISNDLAGGKRLESQSENDLSGRVVEERSCLQSR